MRPLPRQLGKRQFLRHVIFTHRSITRPTLIRKTGLNARSVDRYTHELESRGLIRRGLSRPSRGRPSTIYISRSDQCLFLGMVIDSHQLTTTALDMNGKPLFCHTVPCPANVPKNKLEKMIVEQAENAVGHFPDLIPYAICLGLPTHLQFMSEHAGLHQTFQQLYHTDLECFSTDFLISYDVLRHTWLRGLVAVVVYNGSLLAFQKGQHVAQYDRRLAALWHLPVPAELSLGMTCECGKRGCIQAELSGEALQERYRQINGNLPKNRNMSRNSTIYLEAILGNQQAVAALRAQAEIYGYLARKMMEEAPFEHIILVRSAWANQAPLAHMAGEEFERFSKHPGEMIRSHAYHWADMAFTASQYARRHFAN